jgi:hypothetical protein
MLRSGAIEPGRQVAESGESDNGGPERWVVRFEQPVGWHEKGTIESAGARVETALPGQAYLVTVPAQSSVSLSQIPGVEQDLAGDRGDARCRRRECR